MVITMALALLLGVSVPVGTSSNYSFGFQHACAADAVDGMKRLNLILKKLRDAMGSMKDFDELEKAGLDKKDVDRMRSAMKDKINQMMEDAIYAIRSL
ncbi:hypothetical protein [Mariprofundus ferrooxydans]|nr:hypothetical protein [Mariprofundus ferrooxydans]